MARKLYQDMAPNIFVGCADEMARRGRTRVASNLVDLLLRALSGSIVHLARSIDEKRVWCEQVLKKALQAELVLVWRDCIPAYSLYVGSPSTLKHRWFSSTYCSDIEDGVGHLMAPVKGHRYHHWPATWTETGKTLTG